MKIADHCTLPANPEVVWQALNDPEVLRACLPGCQSLERIDECHFQSTIQVRVGPASATFRGEVELSDLEPPRRYTIVGQGNAGAAGFAKVVARVALEPAGTGTVLTYDADVEIGGKLMSVGARLIQSASAKNLETFFGAFQAHIERVASLQEESAASAAATAGQTVGSTKDVTAAGAVAGFEVPEAPHPASVRHEQPTRTNPGAASSHAPSTGTRWPAWLIATLAGSAGFVVGVLSGHAV